MSTKGLLTILFTLSLFLGLSFNKIQVGEVAASPAPLHLTFPQRCNVVVKEKIVEVVKSEKVYIVKHRVDTVGYPQVNLNKVQPLKPQHFLKSYATTR